MTGVVERTSAWIRQNWEDVFLSIDFILGAVVTVGAISATLLSKTIQAKGATALFVEAGLGVAVLAVALTALAILVAFLGEEYVRVLRRTDLGIAGAIRPYRIISVVSGATTLVALAGALAWDVSPVWLNSIALGLGSGLTVWSIVGTIQLVGITARHGEYRGRIPEIRDEFRRGQEERKKHPA